MATWDLPADVVSVLVAGAKRSAVYRRARPELASVCPLDVWIEDGLGFVQFELEETRRQPAVPGWLVLAVRPGDGAPVAAKIVEPGPEVATMSVSDVFVQ